MAAGVGAVKHVIMDQCGRVYQLNHRCPPVGSFIDLAFIQ
jgi:hypothetical protein